jgi:hypothetical protein
MPARADSRPDFVRGFGLDVPEETEEELEQEEEQAERDDQSVSDEHEEEHALAEASHNALPGSDDTVDMELDVDEADAEVGSITTAAHSRVHSSHVSRLSAALSLRSVGDHVSDPELVAGASTHAEKEGDVEDDAIGEWTGSEDLRTTRETTEDEVRNFSCRVVSTRPRIRADDLSDHNCPLPFFLPYFLVFLPSLSLSLLLLLRRPHLGEHWRVVEPI